MNDSIHTVADPGISKRGGGGGPGSAFDTLGQSVLYYHINDSIHTVLPHE